MLGAARLRAGAVTFALIAVTNATAIGDVLPPSAGAVAISPLSERCLKPQFSLTQLALETTSSAPTAQDGSLLGQGDRALQAQNYEAALTFYAAANALAERNGDLKLSAVALGGLGLTHAALGDFNEASRALTASAGKASAAHRPDIQSRSLINLGNLLLSARESDAVEAMGALSAATSYEDAVTAAHAAGDRVLELQAAAYLVRARSRDKTPEAVSVALAAFTAKFEFAGMPNVRPAIVAADAGLAALPEMTLGTAVRARKFIETLVTKTARSPDPSLAAYGWGLRARLDLADGQFDAALTNTRRALLLAEGARDEFGKFRWFGQLGDIHRRMGARDQAIAAYEGAKLSIARVRGSLPQFDPVSGASIFRETVGPLFASLAELYVSGDEGASGHAALLGKARDTIEVLKQIEVAQYFRDECVAALLGRRRQLEDVLGDAAAVYPLVLNNRVVLLVSQGGTIFQRPSPATPAQIATAVTTFRSALLANRTALKPVQSEGAKLYDWLIRPIEGDLKRRHVETIVFVPDGALRLLPWAALFDRSSNQYLVQQFALGTTVGLELTSPRPLGDIKPNLLLAGLSTAVSDARTGATYEGLANVADELGRIKTHFPSAHLIEAGISKSTLQSELSRTAYTVVHLATHANFSANLRNSFLLATDGRISIDDLEQLIRTTQSGGEPIELLGLSACETAVGNDRASMGLAGIAIKAGARSVFASLWQIPDDSTANLVDAFYGGLATPGVSKAMALQEAQLSLLKGPPVFRHPHFWAPFVLIGNWK